MSRGGGPKFNYMGTESFLNPKGFRIFYTESSIQKLRLGLRKLGSRINNQDFANHDHQTMNFPLVHALHTDASKRSLLLTISTVLNTITEYTY